MKLAACRYTSARWAGLWQAQPALRPRSLLRLPKMQRRLKPQPLDSLRQGLCRRQRVGLAARLHLDGGQPLFKVHVHLQGAAAAALVSNDIVIT